MLLYAVIYVSLYWTNDTICYVCLYSISFRDFRSNEFSKRRKRKKKSNRRENRINLELFSFSIYQYSSFFLFLPFSSSLSLSIWFFLSHSHLSEKQEEKERRKKLSWKVCLTWNVIESWLKDSRRERLTFIPSSFFLSLFLALKLP